MRSRHTDCGKRSILNPQISYESTTKDGRCAMKQEVLEQEKQNADSGTDHMYRTWPISRDVRRNRAYKSFLGRRTSLGKVRVDIINHLGEYVYRRDCTTRMKTGLPWQQSQQHPTCTVDHEWAERDRECLLSAQDSQRQKRAATYHILT